jgi:chromosome segregation protein
LNKRIQELRDKVTSILTKGVHLYRLDRRGSGKSKVVDAMRWVLGEQKTSRLRSEKMENVIFNGTRRGERRRNWPRCRCSLFRGKHKELLPTEYSQCHITEGLLHVPWERESEYAQRRGCRLKGDITGPSSAIPGSVRDSYAISELKNALGEDPHDLEQRHQAAVLKSRGGSQIQSSGRANHLISWKKPKVT